MRTGGGFKLILALYGVSLLLVSARDVLRLSNRPVTVRKAFNYVANSYIVLAIFLMGPWLGSVLPVEPTIVLVIAYFITYRLIWRVP